MLPSGKKRILRTTPGTSNTASKAERSMTVTATAKRRRREAKLDKRFRARVREKSPLGVKNTFLGNTSKKR
jgi:hypothetical protein